MSAIAGLLVNQEPTTKLFHDFIKEQTTGLIKAAWLPWTCASTTRETLRQSQLSRKASHKRLSLIAGFKRPCEKKHRGIRDTAGFGKLVTCDRRVPRPLLDLSFVGARAPACKGGPFRCRPGRIYIRCHVFTTGVGTTASTSSRLRTDPEQFPAVCCC